MSSGRPDTVIRSSPIPADLPSAPSSVVRIHSFRLTDYRNGQGSAVPACSTLSAGEAGVCARRLTQLRGGISAVMVRGRPFGRSHRTTHDGPGNPFRLFHVEYQVRHFLAGGEQGGGNQPKQRTGDEDVLGIGILRGIIGTYQLRRRSRFGR